MNQSGLLDTDFICANVRTLCGMNQCSLHHIAFHHPVTNTKLGSWRSYLKGVADPHVLASSVQSRPRKVEGDVVISAKLLVILETDVLLHAESVANVLVIPRDQAVLNDIHHTAPAPVVLVQLDPGEIDLSAEALDLKDLLERDHLHTGMTHITGGFERNV